MRKLVPALVIVPLGVLLVALSVVNRKPVTLGLNPFDANSGLAIEAPLFLFLLGAFALGLVVGGLATWLGQGKWRKTARVEAREASMAPAGRSPGEGARGPRCPAKARSPRRRLTSRDGIFERAETLPAAISAFPFS